MAIERVKIKVSTASIDTPRAVKSVIAAFLVKLAKHMALFTCLVILGIATGRASVTEVTIFLMVVAATVTYSIGRSLERGSSRIRR